MIQSTSWKSKPEVEIINLQVSLKTCFEAFRCRLRRNVPTRNIEMAVDSVQKSEVPKPCIMPPTLPPIRNFTKIVQQSHHMTPFASSLQSTLLRYHAILYTTTSTEKPFTTLSGINFGHWAYLGTHSPTGWVQPTGRKKNMSRGNTLIVCVGVRVHKHCCTMIVCACLHPKGEITPPLVIGKTPCNLLFLMISSPNGAQASLAITKRNVPAPHQVNSLLSILKVE